MYEHVFVYEPEEEPEKCYRCGEVKPAEAFHGGDRRSVKRDSFCKPCRKAYGREHYLANRARYIEQARVQKQRLALEIAKCDVVCANCHRRRTARRRGNLRMTLAEAAVR